VSDLIIAPFWGDADTTSAGSVTYGITTDNTTLTKAAEQIRAAFPAHQTFSPSFLFITTWTGVGYYNDPSASLVSC